MNPSMIEQQNPDEYKKKIAFAEALAQLDTKEKAAQSTKGYGKAYFWSFIMPPVGVWYFFKFLFFSQGEWEDIIAGVISLLLTVVSLIASLWAFSTLFSGGNPQDLERLTKDLSLPENQREILQLFK